MERREAEREEGSVSMDSGPVLCTSYRLSPPELVSDVAMLLKLFASFNNEQHKRNIIRKIQCELFFQKKKTRFREI